MTHSLYTPYTFPRYVYKSYVPSEREVLVALAPIDCVYTIGILPISPLWSPVWNPLRTRGTASTRCKCWPLLLFWFLRNCFTSEPEHIRWKFRIRNFWCIPWAGRFQDIQKGIGSLWNWTMATTSLANCVKVQFWNRIVQYLCSESILVQKVSSGRISTYPVSFKETFLFQYTCHFLSQFGPRVDQPSDTFSYDDFVSFMIYLLNQNR